MIYGQLKNLEQEKSAFSPVLQKALLYLKNTDLAKLAIGRHDIEGDTIFALVSEYQTEPKQDRRPEAHQKYIDIQYLASGEEIIGCSLLSDQCIVLQDELKEKDLIFYKEIMEETDMVLEPGTYAVLFPNDVHRPNCMRKTTQTVKKVVIKIAISQLSDD